MLTSIIITTYNAHEKLIKVLDCFKYQSIDNFEIIIADDGSDKSIKEKNLSIVEKLGIPIKYVWHDDLGFRAAKIRNEAVKKSTGEYIIFLDGDCLPFKDFVFEHIKLSEKGFFCRGNRIKLSKKFTNKILHKDFNINKIKFNDFVKLRTMNDINRLLPLCRLGDFKLRKFSKKRWEGAKTCNLAVWKTDFEKINGFDENYIGWGREDSDLVVRLINSGIYRKEATFSTGVLHMWHDIISRENFSRNDKLLQLAINEKRTYIDTGLTKR